MTPDKPHVHKWSEWWMIPPGKTTFGKPEPYTEQRVCQFCGKVEKR